MSPMLSFFRELLLKLLRDSSTSIQTLHIAALLPLPDLVHCLQLVPRLKSLILGFVRPNKECTFHFPEEGVDFIGMLLGSPAVVAVDSDNANASQSSSELPLCPELRTLKLFGMSPLPTPSVLLNLISSRRKHCSILLNLISSRRKHCSIYSSPDSCKCHMLKTLEIFSNTACNRNDASPEITKAFERLRGEGMDICITYRGWSDSDTEAKSSYHRWLDSDTDGRLDSDTDGRLDSDTDEWLDADTDGWLDSGTDGWLDSDTEAKSFNDNDLPLEGLFDDLVTSDTWKIKMHLKSEELVYI
ncbi:hypothetical protein K435DRAFT_871947 [Dendrothele bispora CBS 962.96]|uniref:Uncharacterized protein n=1 Tax=Dendrothele bispora (strain CBS 962.96) TaxID=1314807 RepID=A0A4S8L3B3_DENBC|nr:hypothetical protein K435DRAFT_871947 [Dendrothele bispora CBS 962.96]